MMNANHQPLYCVPGHSNKGHKWKVLFFFKSYCARVYWSAKEILFTPTLITLYKQLVRIRMIHPFEKSLYCISLILRRSDGSPKAVIPWSLDTCSSNRRVIVLPEVVVNILFFRFYNFTILRTEPYFLIFFCRKRWFQSHPRPICLIVKSLF